MFPYLRKECINYSNVQVVCSFCIKNALISEDSLVMITESLIIFVTLKQKAPRFVSQTEIFFFSGKRF